MLEPFHSQHLSLQRILQPAKLRTAALPQIPNTERILHFKYKAKDVLNSFNSEKLRSLAAIYIFFFYIAFPVMGEEGGESLYKPSISPVHNRLPFQDRYC